MFLAILLSIAEQHVEVYRFNNSYVELWYHISSREFSLSDTRVIADSLFEKYKYQLEIYNYQNNDSAHIAGTKGLFRPLKSVQKDFHFVDYIPISLYPGLFHYRLLIDTKDFSKEYKGQIEIIPDTGQVYTSDLIIGKRCNMEIFSYRGLPFIPVIDLNFELNDTLFSYIEIYGLRADSLYYDSRYKIIGNSGNLIYERKLRNLKCGYQIVDTTSIPLNGLTGGEYTFLVEIYDSVSASRFQHKRLFTIRPLKVDISNMPFSSEIQFLVSQKEFKRFKVLSQQEKEIYLKKFWTEHDYQEFVKRLLEADEKFSTRRMKGRNSKRGRYYIKYGPPECIDDIPMNRWGKPLELWHYYSQGKDVLFCDVHNDGDPELIAVLRVNELFHIIELGYYKPEDIRKWPWLTRIAPGTYFRQKSEEEEDILQED